MTWYGDILSTDAVLGFGLFLFRRSSDRTLPISALQFALGWSPEGKEPWSTQTPTEQGPGVVDTVASPPNADAAPRLLLGGQGLLPGTDTYGRGCMAKGPGQQPCLYVPRALTTER
ncbi:hypothetical protein ASNO1_29520 [Corallococcus caeni]|uniref:Uncharacterized protein n=1 Tax=Corallococcus caeni TaxID=3082388 RepID=A0ABQ6QRP9_9BACT|nr:hypothetical protein ASNO1_29520 [Corallococcus sp. NO1]